LRRAKKHSDIRLARPGRPGCHLSVFRLGTSGRSRGDPKFTAFSHGRVPRRDCGHRSSSLGTGRRRSLADMAGMACRGLSSGTDTGLRGRRGHLWAAHCPIRHRGRPIGSPAAVRDYRWLPDLRGEVGSQVRHRAAHRLRPRAELAPRVGLPDEPRLAAGLELLAGGSVLLIVASLLGDWGRLHGAAVTAVSLAGFIWFVIIVIGGFTAYGYLSPTVAPSIATTFSYVNPAVAVAALQRTDQLAHGAGHCCYRYRRLFDRVDKIGGTRQDVSPNDIRARTSQESIGRRQRRAWRLSKRSSARPRPKNTEASGRLHGGWVTAMWRSDQFAPVGRGRS
jgi:hypothetical protein